MTDSSQVSDTVLPDIIEQSIDSIDKTEDILLENQDYNNFGVNQILNPFVQKSLTVCVFECSNEETKECLKCKRHFCIFHSNRISPNFCQDCFKQISLIKDKFERRVEDYDLATDTVTVRKESCDRIKLDGPDWVFYTAWIDTLNDDELQGVFEFHFFILKMIETQNEMRGQKYKDKLKGIKFSVGMSVTTTTDKRTKREVKQEDPMKKLKKLFPGKTDDQLKAIMAIMAE